MMQLYSYSPSENGKDLQERSSIVLFGGTCFRCIGDNACSNGCDWIWVKYVLQCVHGIFDRKMHIVKCLALQNIVCTDWAVHKWQYTLFLPFACLESHFFTVISTQLDTLSFLYLFAQKTIQCTLTFFEMVLSSAFLGENVITFYWQKPSWLYFFRLREEMWTGVQELKASLLWTWRQNRDKLEIAILLRNREHQRNGIYAINSKTAQNCFQLIVSSCFPILSPAPCWPSFWLKRRKCRKKKMKLLGKNLFF